MAKKKSRRKSGVSISRLEELADKAESLQEALAALQQEAEELSQDLWAWVDEAGESDE